MGWFPRYEAGFSALQTFPLHFVLLRDSNFPMLLLTINSLYKENDLFYFLRNMAETKENPWKVKNCSISNKCLLLENVFVAAL